jgi:acetyl esterase/lipase
MSSLHLLSPELRTIAEYPFDLQLRTDTLPAVRNSMNNEAYMREPGPNVERSEVLIESADGSRISCLLYTPSSRSKARGAYLYCHGGGFIIGSKSDSDSMSLDLCEHLDIVVLSVGYRLAPEAKAPQVLADCYAGLAYLHENHRSLNIDPARIAVGGESSGGGLAAALAIEARDRGEYAICHQHLTYPMLDDRTGSVEQPGDPLTGEFIWTRERNQFAWDCFLGREYRRAPFVPARTNDFTGLPPAWIYTVTLDLFRDENIAYAQRLMQASVAAELIVEPGACHGFTIVPGTQILQRYNAASLSALRRAIGVG